MQPVVDEAAPLAVDRRRDAAAAVMADHDDVLHLEHVDGELQHGEIIGILRRREVRDVAVDEELAGVDADDLVRGNPAVGAADPQVFRGLLVHQPLEKAGIDGDHPARPCPVAGFEVIEHAGR